jgi:nucleotide-binding universal stress UspA family protein
MRRILLGNDGSNSACHALDFAIELAHRYGAELHVLAVGDPAELMVRYAEEHAIDHIVVGHRGLTPFERWLIGSVARQVIAYTPCTVAVASAAEVETHVMLDRLRVECAAYLEPRCAGGPCQPASK